MNVLVNGTTLNVNNAYTEREENITLLVLVPQSEMDYADLKDLFKGNTGDIIKTDGSASETFSGFTYANIIDDDANGQHIVRLTSSEYEFQLARNRQLEKSIEDLKKSLGQGNDGGISAEEIMNAVMEGVEEV